LRSLHRAEEKLLQERDHVTLELIAQEAQVDLVTAQTATGGPSTPPLSLDRVIGDADGSFTLGDAVADDTSERAFDEAETETILGSLLGALDARQRQIIQMRYGENRTYREVGEKLHLTGARVQQIESQALTALRRSWMLPQTR
jgi:RNA polymerase sigma-B factor